MNIVYEKLKALSNFIDNEINERKKLIDKKIKNKEFNVPLVCCLPYKRKKYHPFEQYLMEDSWIYMVSEEYHKENYFIRDKYMVDNCDILLAIWDGIEFGGTYNTIEYAKQINRKILYLPQSILQG